MIWEKLGTVWNGIAKNLQTIRIADIIDIIVVAVFIYYAYTFIKNRRAGKLAVGIVTLFVLLAVASLADMRVVKYLMQNVLQVGIIAVIIVFQPELRAVLEKVGGGAAKGVRSFGDFKNGQSRAAVLDDIVQAASELGEKKEGALIVFERSTKLEDLILTGTVIDSAVSVSLVKNIFFKNSPLHDGALIVRDDRLYSAGCLLPLSSSQHITKDLGTRHRAALGMSENSDAVVVVVSEETGNISVAVDGELIRGCTAESLRQILGEYFEDEDSSKTIRKRIEYFKTTRSVKRATSQKGKNGNDGSGSEK